MRSKSQVSQSRVLIGTCPDNFAGAGKIATQIMREVVREGIETNFVGLNCPHLYVHVPGPQPDIIIPPLVEAPAVDKSVLITYRLAESIADLVRYKYPRAVITLWATYLFPFAHAALLAKKALSLEGIDVRLVVSPAGSDIWQLGPQLPNLARYVLVAPEVNVLLTYTKQFAKEVAQIARSDRRIEHIYPINDGTRFRPYTPEEKQLGRQKLQISKEAFVICCHSNMRPIKRPEIVISLALELSEILKGRHTVLLMVGPVVDSLRSSQSTNGSRLSVRWEGISNRVEEFLSVADVALNWSAHDSFNGSLMEAMASGLPVVSTRVVGIAPGIEACGGGKVFCDDESVAAVRFLKELAEDEDFRCRTGSQAASYASITFGRERLLSLYVNVLFPDDQNQKSVST
jgi:glycosyltransferase involved in cell wall biosynthesis